MALDPHHLVSVLVNPRVGPPLETLYFVVVWHRPTTYGRSAPLTSAYGIPNLLNMPPRKAKTKEFDEAILQTLTEPITVTLRKIVAGKPSPIEIPPGPGEAIGGRGYSADMVRSLPSFISQEWSGGGMYDCAATGANGEQMKWEMYFHPNQVPELTPPTRTNTAAPPAPAPAAPPAQVMAPPAVPGASGNYLSQVAQTYPQNHGQPPFAGQPASGQAPAANPYAWQVPGFGGVQQPRFGAAPAPFQDPAAKEREERLKLEAKMERQTQQAVHDKQMASLTEELRRVQEQISKHPAVEESAALRQAQEKINALEQQSSTQVLMQQMQQMQAQTTQLMQTMQANTDKQIDAIRRDAESSKADPMMPMLMQVMQQQGAAQQQSMQTFVQFMQSNQTAQVEAAKLAQANQMGPREMVDLVRTANAGQDHMAAGYARMQDMWVNSMDSILQANGPGVHPALAMIGSGVEGGLGIAQQYLEMKQGETQANAQARTIQAQMEAQARVRSAQIKAEAANGARGAETPVDGAPAGEDAPETEETEVPEGVGDPGVEEVEVISGPNEERVFGAALEPVMRLRKGVESGAVSPAQAAAVVLQAVDYFGKAAAEGDELPPIFALFQEERFADLIDALIPEARANFRDEASAALYQGVANLKRQAGMEVSPPLQPAPEPQPVA